MIVLQLVDVLNVWCSGLVRVMTANNDAQVRVFDASSFACISKFSFPWSVNVSGFFS